MCEGPLRGSRRAERARTSNGGYRRVSPIAPRPREGPLIEPTADARPGPRERVLMLRVFGRLPVSGVTRCSEAGVRKASGEETAGGVCAGSGVGLWRFSLCMPRSLDIERGSRPSNHRGVGFGRRSAGSERWSCSERSPFWRSTAGLTVAIGGGQASPMRHRRETGAAMWDGGRSVRVMSCRR